MLEDYDKMISSYELFRCLQSSRYFSALKVIHEKKNKIKIPAEMSKNLMILHSYILVKVGNVTTTSLMYSQSVNVTVTCVDRFTLD